MEGEGMRILITGGGGFIGRSLAVHFAADHSVYAANHEDLDLEDPKAVEYSLRIHHFDVVLHAAGYDANSPVVPREQSVCLEKNLRMFINLVRCADDYGRLIYFGSGSEVPKEYRQLHMDEFDCCWHPPDESYGLAKWLMNKIAPLHGKIVNLRLFGVFGKYDEWRYRVIPNLCAQALYYDKLVLKRNAMHDFMFIDDLCKAVEALIEPSHGGGGYSNYNVCPNNPVTFRRLAEMVREISGRDLAIECPEEMFHSYCGDNSRFKNDFPLFRFTPVEIGIRRLYEWYSAHKELIPKEEVMKWL